MFLSLNHHNHAYCGNSIKCPYLPKTHNWYQSRGSTYRLTSSGILANIDFHASYVLLCVFMIFWNLLVICIIWGGAWKFWCIWTLIVIFYWMHSSRGSFICYYHDESLDFGLWTCWTLIVLILIMLIIWGGVGSMLNFLQFLCQKMSSLCILSFWWWRGRMFDNMHMEIWRRL